VLHIVLHNGFASPSLPSPPLPSYIADCVRTAAAHCSEHDIPGSERVVADLAESSAWQQPFLSSGHCSSLPCCSSLSPTGS